MKHLFKKPKSAMSDTSMPQPPHRPLLPLTLPLVIGLYIGVIVGEGYWWGSWCAGDAVIDTSYISRVLIVFVISIFIDGLIAFVGNKMMRVARLLKTIATVFALMACTFLLGLIASSGAYQELHTNIRLATLESSGSAEILITGDAEETSNACFSLGEMRLSEGRTLAVRIFWSDVESAIPLGQICTVRGSFSPLKQVDAQHRFHEQMIGGTFTVTRLITSAYDTTIFSTVGKVRAWCLERLRGEVSTIDEATALLESLLLGYQSDLSESALQRDYSCVGLAHMLAVSGTHLTILSALLISLLRMMHFGKKTTGTCCLVFVILYIMLTGLQASAIRSGLMAAAALAIWLFGRRRHALSALLAMASLMLIFQPCDAFSLGFQLSVLSCLAIIVFSSWVSYWLLALMRGVGTARYFSKHVIDPISVTLVAQAVTAPLTVAIFAQFSLIAPLANCVILPISALLLGGGLIALGISAISSSLGAPLFEALRLLAMVSNGLASWLAGVPGACVPLVFDQTIMIGIVLTAMILAYSFWPLPRSHDHIKRYRRILGIIMMAIILLIAVRPSNSAISITIMDVGQGDAILVREANHAILVDTGPSDTALLKALARNGVTRLDAVLLTHFDSDHCAALGALRGSVAVERVLVSAGSLALALSDPDIASVLVEARSVVDDSDDLIELTYQSIIQLGSQVNLLAVWPDKPVTESDNENSLCLLLAYDGDQDGTTDITALFTGDAESATLDRIIDLNKIDRLDILKVAHHGSKKSITDMQIADLRIRTACISVGLGNRYGHPHAAIVEALGDAGAAVYRTDQNGDIVITLERTFYTVSCATIGSYPT
jgi:competence protein ComEC